VIAKGDNHGTQQRHYQQHQKVGLVIQSKQSCRQREQGLIQKKRRTKKNKKKKKKKKGKEKKKTSLHETEFFALAHGVALPLLHHPGRTAAF
jgi:hypothetical protein